MDKEREASLIQEELDGIANALIGLMILTTALGLAWLVVLATIKLSGVM